MVKLTLASVCYKLLETNLLSFSFAVFSIVTCYGKTNESIHIISIYRLSSHEWFLAWVDGFAIPNSMAVTPLGNGVTMVRI